MARSRVTFLLVVLTIARALPGFAAQDRTVNIYGSCSRTVPTDRGAITITADFTDRDLDSAVRKAALAYDRANDEIKRLQLDDLDARTVEYSVTENREWTKNKSVFKGYRARIGLKVTTSSISRLGKVIEIAAREDIRDVSQLTMFLSDEKLHREQDLCLKQAGEDARAKAKKLAGSVGAILGEVVSISENVPAPVLRLPRPEPLAIRAGAETSPGPAIQSGQQEVSVSVQAAFALH